MFRTCLLSLVILGAAGGCAQLDTPGSIESGAMKQNAFDGQIQYPRDPLSHYELSNDPSTAKPVVLNAVAYARYAVEIMTTIPAPVLSDAEQLLITLALVAEESTVPYSAGKNYWHQTASDELVQAFDARVRSEARQLAGQGGHGRMARSVLDGEASLRACQASGIPGDDCCASLLFFEALGGADAQVDGYLDAADFHLTASQSRVDQGTLSSLQPFNQSGLRSWLAYCGPHVTHTPRSVSAFKLTYGDYHRDPDWAQELHPISPAKQAGRRIYRKRLSDGTWVSVAESLTDECGVRETETVVQPAEGQSRFGVYDYHGDSSSYAFFPTRRINEDALRFAPDACMGCHYSMDSRRFNVLAPSFEALNLKLYESGAGPGWRDHSHCRVPGERVVLHGMSPH